MKTITLGSATITAKELNNPFSQALGLMFQKPKPVLMNFGKPRRALGVHMLFVFCPLDLVFLNQHKTITEIKQGLQPFRFYRAKQPASYLLELPAGLARATGIKPGQTLRF